MITRIYIDNFRTLVNFEWKPGRLALLLGVNGSGKSSIMDILAGLRAVIAEQEEIRRWFPSASRARWETRLELRIEVDATIKGNKYAYVLLIEHHADDPAKSRVHKETLSLGSKTLMSFADGELQLYRDNGSLGPLVTSDWTRTGLGGIAAGKDNKLLSDFKEWIREDLWFLRPDPRAMSSRTDEDATGPWPDLRNFASWLPRWMAQDFPGAMRAMQALQQAIEGFQSLQVNKSAPRLEAAFQPSKGAKYTVDFAELSDGQRQLCALYFITNATLHAGRLVFFDEPDNYVALREIQPWLNEVIEHALGENGAQIWFVSHHPEILNQIAPQYGTRFFRHQGGPTRIEPFKGVEGLTAGETMARGWEDE